MNFLANMTDTVKISSFIAIGLAIIAGTIIAGVRKIDTKKVVYTALLVSLSFALSFIKISPVTYGGSITLASMLPIIILSYAFGIGYGVFAGVIFGLLNFISDPYVLTYATFFLDYIFAFASVGLAGIFKKIFKNTYANLTLGIIAVYALRFIFHLISGIIYFKKGAIWADIPQSNAFTYSLLYQLVYLPGDAVLVVIVAISLIKTKVFDLLLKKISDYNLTNSDDIDEERV